MDELHRHTPRLNGLAGAHHCQPHLAHQAVLPELSFHQTQGEGGAINGDVYLPQQVGQAADMILMAVGEEHPPDFIPVANKVGEVRDNQVHPQKVVVREGETAVHHQNILPALVDGDVLANLPQPPQGDDAQRRTAGLQLVGGAPQGALHRFRSQRQGAVFHQGLAPAGSPLPLLGLAGWLGRRLSRLLGLLLPPLPPGALLFRRLGGGGKLLSGGLRLRGLAGFFGGLQRSFLGLLPDLSHRAAAPAGGFLPLFGGSLRLLGRGRTPAAAAGVELLHKPFRRQYFVFTILFFCHVVSYLHLFSVNHYLPFFECRKKALPKHAGKRPQALPALHRESPWGMVCSFPTNSPGPCKKGRGYNSKIRPPVPSQPIGGYKTSRSGGNSIKMREQALGCPAILHKKFFWFLLYLLKSRSSRDRKSVV